MTASNALMHEEAQETTKHRNRKAGNRSVSSSLVLQISQDSIITCDVSKSDDFTQRKILSDHSSSFVMFHFTKPVYLFWNTMVCNLKEKKKEEEVGPLKELFQLSQSSFCLKRCAIL